MNESEVQMKIKTLTEAEKWRNQLQKEEKKVVFTNGCFDLLHRGHIDYLMEARSYGDALIVAINSDDSVKKLKGQNRPINNQNDRAFMIAAFPFVDAVVIFDTVRCDGILKSLRPAIYVKGGDYNLETIDTTEKSVLQNIGCEIRFSAHKFIQGYSTTEMLNKII